MGGREGVRLCGVASSPTSASLFRAFASDNTSPAAPEVVDAVLEAGVSGCVGSYGEDAWTQAAEREIRGVFEADCEVHLVFTGTAANALALASLCAPWESVFCHAEAHVEKDESAAPEFFGGGMKLHPLPGEQGKVALADAAAILGGNRGVHSPQPRVISVTQSTELGTVYGLDELRAVSAFARRHGMLVHMDGARFANAVATLGCSPADASWRSGVDVLSFGLSKNGGMFAEAVVFFQAGLSRGFGNRRKQGGQLASKMRYLAASWVGALRGGMWLRRAAHANAMARRLGDGLVGCGLRLQCPVQANGVFVHLPQDLVASLEAEGWHFYKFLEPDVFRFVCSWRTDAGEVDRLEAAIRARLR